MTSQQKPTDNVGCNLVVTSMKIKSALLLYTLSYIYSLKYIAYSTLQ